MLGCQTEEQRIAAVLHDTDGDGGITIEYIEEHFGKRIADAVDALSRRLNEGETYSEFIHRCGKNEIARPVKLADLKDNMDENRLGRHPNAADERRLAKYRSEEHHTELQSPVRTSYGVYSLKQKPLKIYTEH